MIPTSPLAYDGIGLYYRDTSSARVNADQTFWHNMSFMKIFDWQIWILMSICTVVVTILSAIRHTRLTQLTWCIWFIVANVLLSVFTNLMAINFVAPISLSGRPFSTLEDLARKVLSTECRFVIPKSVDTELILELVNPRIADNPIREIFQGKSRIIWSLKRALRSRADPFAQK